MSSRYVRIDLKDTEVRVLSFLCCDAGRQLLRTDQDAAEWLTTLGALLAKALGEDDAAEP